MKHPRKRVTNRGYQLTAEAVRFLNENRPVSFNLTAKGIDFVNDCKAPLGAIAEDENLPAPRKIDAIIAEIRAPKPAPTTCWGCGCTSIEVATVGNYPPAYICPLCDLWLGDVNGEINVKAELIRKQEDLIWALQGFSLGEESEFQETLELIRLIRTEIHTIESGE